MLQATCSNVASFWSKISSSGTSVGSSRLSLDLLVSSWLFLLVRVRRDDSPRDLTFSSIQPVYSTGKKQFGEVNCSSEKDFDGRTGCLRRITDDRVADRCKRRTGSGLLDRIWKVVAKSEIAETCTVDRLIETKIPVSREKTRDSTRWEIKEASATSK